MQSVIRVLTRNPAWSAAILSLLISTWNIISDDLINSDGILYIEVAGLLLEGDWQAAIARYNWPFYSALIAIMSKISFLSLETSAYVLNVTLQALLAYVFVRCSQVMGGNRWVATFAAILLLTNVTLNGYRDLIIRDFGYWAFFFTALYFFLQYHRTRLVKYALGFSISVLIATLFRIEGIVFAFMAPLIFLFQTGNWKQRVYRCGWTLSPLIVLGGLAVTTALLTSSSLLEQGRLFEPLFYLKTTLQGISQGIVEKGRLIEEVVLDVNARNMGTKSMLAILVMMFVLKIISASGYIPLFFSIWAGLSARIRSSMTGVNVIIGFMAINALVLATVLISRTFLTPRYAMTFALLMTLLAAFALASFFRTEVPVAGHRRSVWRRRGQILIVVVLGYMFLDGVTSFSSSKAYIRESGIWLKENVAAEARLFSNEEAVYYYSGRTMNQDVISSALTATRLAQLPPINLMELRSFDYVVMRIGRKQTGFEEKVIAWAGSQPIHRAANKRGDAILIFKVHK
ncbi:hypothetical protein [Sulfuriflexus mobilis]|uniref:hypothetical protein n=1 Tax=Sulfuriflexus mobilis TaxID=1811807 RepID=UPI000F84D71F|nr:hypothetical protein [Sulfuriflexus mobilis]